MTVSVAGRLIQDANALSALGRLSLAFIDGGGDWLAWAIAEPVARYEFADETMLVGQVQSGLHASRFALLPTLAIKVSPIKLMTLGLADLRLVARAEGGDDNAVLAAQVRKILADHQLVTQADLATGPALLRELGQDASPLFQSMNFDDCLAMWRLASEPPPPFEPAASTSLQREAGAFAVDQARTPAEFCDYYRVYLDIAPPLASATPEQRRQAATTALQTLLPLLFGTLDCPQIEGLPSPGDVELAVSGWLSRGRQIGFSRLSQAVQQIVRHTHWQGDAGAAALKAIALYLQSAQAFLLANRPGRGRLGQDGATCVFALDTGNLCGELLVGANGVISLRDFGPRAQPPTPTETTS